MLESSDLFLVPLLTAPTFVSPGQTSVPDTDTHIELPPPGSSLLTPEALPTQMSERELLSPLLGQWQHHKLLGKPSSPPFLPASSLQALGPVTYLSLESLHFSLHGCPIA